MDSVIYNGDCFDFMNNLNPSTVDVVLTSPFYNTNKKSGGKRTIQDIKIKDGEYSYIRYDTHIDNLTIEEYNEFSVRVFDKFDKILKPNGCVLYNLGYGSDNTEGIFKAVAEILSRTNFTIADVIVWKKNSALPNNVSRNKLTRIWEFVFVFCRKSESQSFFSNKKITSTRANGQNMYENIYNFIEARNNDCSCPFNKATFSSELCEKLLKIYAPLNSETVVFDPFIGSGTTAIACINLGLQYLGCEISKNQCNFAKERILKHLKRKDCENE